MTDAASARARDRSIERTGSARWTPRGAMAPFVARATHRKRRRGGVRGRELVRERGRRAPEGALRCEIGGVGGGSASRAGEGGGGAGGGSGRRSARARWIDREGNARGFLASREAAGRAEDAPERRGRRRRRWRSRGWSTANVPDERWTCAWRDGRVRARRRECRGRARFPDFDASRRSAARRIICPWSALMSDFSADRWKTRACRIARRPHTSSRAVVTGCLSR